MNPVCNCGFQWQCNPEIKLTSNIAVKFTRKHPLELVIFCGSPGAGKSTYYWNNLQPLGYERVNQDILKTVSPTLLMIDHSVNRLQRPKCLKVARELLEAKKSVVVGESRLSPMSPISRDPADPPQITPMPTLRPENTGRH